MWVCPHSPYDHHDLIFARKGGRYWEIEATSDGVAIQCIEGYPCDERLQLVRRLELPSRHISGPNFDWLAELVVKPRTWKHFGLNGYLTHVSVEIDRDGRVHWNTERNTQFVMPGPTILDTYNASLHPSPWITLQEREIVVPYLHLMAVCSLFPLLWGSLAVRRTIRSWRRMRRGLCVRCGYDLRESPERCPECGMEAKVKALRTVGQSSRVEHLDAAGKPAG
jgi:hypothetical protein